MPCSSPREVAEGLVCFGHAVGLLTDGAGFPFAICCVIEFASEPLGHGLSLLSTDGRNDPSEGQTLSTTLCHQHA